MYKSLYYLAGTLSCISLYLQVPACLILTMPRSGKSFKMFPKIIPSTELDITGLLADGNLS